jgi:hypothetical protein
MYMKFAAVKQEYPIGTRHTAQIPLELREAGCLAYLGWSGFGGQYRAILRAGGDSLHFLHFRCHQQRTMAAGRPPRGALVCDKVMS